MKKFMVKTLGCKANYADGQLLEVGLAEKGFSSTRDLNDADLVIVNSCTVTDEADKQSKKMVRDIHRKNPRAKIIYTGCGAEVDPESALLLKGLSAVIGNQDKTRAAELISEFLLTQSFSAAEVDSGDGSATAEVNSVGRSVDSAASMSVPAQILGGVSNYAELISRHPLDREWTLPETRLDDILKLERGASSTFRTRAFLKIQEGCDAFCTYCIIPYGRGPARSLSIENVVGKIQELAAHGIQEVVLTGTNIGDYGLDWAGKLMIDDLMEAILVQTSLPRLRVSSLDPTEISERMIQLMETHESFCPHFHVSLQNVSSKVLKLMKRKYSFAEVETCLTRLSQMKRKPFVGMDYITGFPGESAVDFDESVSRLAGLYWQRLHVFPYSERASTPATRLPNVVAPSVRKERARVLQAMSMERLTEWYSLSRQQFTGESGIVHGVLLENYVKGPDGTRDWVSGYSPTYQRVILPFSKTETQPLNQVVDVQVSNWLVDRAGGEVTWLGKLQPSSVEVLQ